MPARPTLRSLAAEAGVSPMTVSLALRESREVSAATRRRLQRLAATRGYVPDPTLTKLMHHLRARAPQRFKATVCALSQTGPNALVDHNDYLNRLIGSLRARAESLGYGFDLINADDYPTRPQLQRVLLSRGIEGIVILPLRIPGGLDKRVGWERFSVVSAASSLLSPVFHSVMPHHFDNMLRACRALTTAGYRRIGFSISRHWNERVHNRWSGAYAWQNEFGGTERVTTLQRGDSGEPRDDDAFMAWLEHERPDAVVSETLDPALIEATVRRLPRARQPLLVTMNLPSHVTAVGIDQRADHIGAFAMELLAGMVTRGERGVPAAPHTTMINGTWIGPAGDTPIPAARPKSLRREEKFLARPAAQPLRPSSL
jgi:LacI family transcriptional regulator